MVREVPKDVRKRKMKINTNSEHREDKIVHEDYVCKYQDEFHPNTRWVTDSDTLEHIQEMIKLRTDLNNPEIWKITTIEEKII